MESEPGAPRFMYRHFGFLAASSALPVPLFLGQGPKREWQPRGIHILKLWTHGDHSLRVSEVFLVVLGPPSRIPQGESAQDSQGSPGSDLLTSPGGGRVRR